MSKKHLKIIKSFKNTSNYKILNCDVNIFIGGNCHRDLAIGLLSPKNTDVPDPGPILRVIGKPLCGLFSYVLIS